MKSPRRPASSVPLVSALALRALALGALTVGCGGAAFTPMTSGDDASPGDAGDAAQDGGSLPPGDASASDAIAPEPTSWCNGRGVTFCEDFDESVDVAALAAKWQGGVLGNGTLALVADPGAPSAPRAFVATAGNNDAAVLVHIPFPVSNARSIRVEYDLRIDHQSVQLFDAAPLVSLVLGPDPNVDTTVFLYIAYGGALTLAWSDAADAGRGFHYYSIANATPPAGVWSGRWGIELSMIDGSIHVLHGGVPIGSPMTGVSPGLLHVSAVTLAAGLSHDTGSTGTVAVQMDNLVLDVK